MSQDEFKKYDGEVHEGGEHLAPYPLTRLAPAIDLVDLAKEIAKADATDDSSALVR